MEGYTYYNKTKYYDKQPCKLDPSNAGIGCCQPRICTRCGWNPAVAKRRNEKILKKLGVKVDG